MKGLFTKILLTGMLPLAVYGQTIVNTEPENRKAILEEFTGIHCVYCPDGHAIATMIENNNPGLAYALNIHQGGYATPSGNEPDFRTQWGNAIANQTGLLGYPAGTVNRQNFPGHEMGNAGTTAMDRGQWAWAANQVLASPSYLNMAVEASIDLETRLLTVHVEGYYTGNSPVSSNFLNVALMQNNTLGPQTGGGMGNNYNHMRRLVDLLTGQWGEEITTVSQGDFVDKTYTYTIPEDYKGVPAILSDMQVMAFMTETHQYIISGDSSFPSLLGLEFANDAKILSIADIDKSCINSVEPTFTIINNGENPLTSLDIEYSVNGGEVHTYTWSGNLSSLHIATVTLPEINYDQLDVNELDITIATPDQNPDNNTMVKEFERAVDATSVNLMLTIQTDHKGSQTRWVLRDSNQQNVQQGNGYGNNETYEIPITLPGADCYTFRIIDTGSDGGATFLLKDENGTVILDSDGNYGQGFIIEFSQGLLGIAEVQAAEISIYPNPSTGIVNINSKTNIDAIHVYDITGKSVSTVNNILSNQSVLNLSHLAKGVYIVKIVSGKTVTTQKIMIK